ncbi:MAG: type II/IV secretion system protein [Myxococcales bacterium]|nr:type II/IV secretion system protein [Myxococcales bacterium]
MALVEHPLTVLTVIGGAIGAGYGLKHLLAQRQRAATAATAPIARLDVKPGTRINQLPAFRARVQWYASAPSPDIIAFLDDLMTIGLSLNASDIHMTPAASKVATALRIDGVLYELSPLPLELYEKVVSRVKVMANLPIYVKNTPQDGQIGLHGGRHRARVSVLPTNHGEKLVLRLSSADYGKQQLDDLGLHTPQLAALKALLNTNQGMIVVTGPTGSGKTTTMYASLLHIQRTRGHSTNIVTLEDPVEFDFPEFSQTQIDPATGLTFAAGLRSVLRQDPDVILVGEIRDDETASIALRAAMTGHLLLTTLHADRAASVFNRLIQLGVEPFHVASAVRAVISQRLCQRLCPSCRREHPVTDEQRTAFRLASLDVPDGPFYIGEGCEACLGKGLEGRVAIYEVLIVSNPIRDMINEERPTHHIERAARELGMRSLVDDGLALARAGVVPLDEILRVITA